MHSGTSAGQWDKLFKIVQFNSGVQQLVERVLAAHCTKMLIQVHPVPVSLELGLGMLFGVRLQLLISVLPKRAQR